MGITLPSPYMFAKSMQVERELIRKKILDLVGLHPYSISTDEACTKGMTMKCVAIVLSFVNRKERKVQSACLPLVQLTDQATANNIRELVTDSIRQFGLDLSKCIRITTDGAANMKAAFA